MDNRPLIEKLTKSFNRNDLTLFFQTSGKFKPEKEDYRHFLEKENFQDSFDIKRKSPPDGWDSVI